MSDLISRKALLEKLKRSRMCHAQNGRELELLCRCENIVKEQPTVEAVPVVYGEWEQTRFACEYICSNCQALSYAQITKTGYKKFNFCPHCGADMRKKE